MPQDTTLPDLTSLADLERLGDRSENPGNALTMGDVIAARYSRREVLRGALAATSISAAIPTLAALVPSRAKAASGGAFVFTEVVAGVDENHRVPDGYEAQVLLRWGDPIFPDAPEFDPIRQSAERQARQFGYNNDFIGLAPLPGEVDVTDRALLVVNHEYTNPELMFPDWPGDEAVDLGRDLVDIEMMAHGGSVIEIRREGARWRLVIGSSFNRRITAETPMTLSGPAAGHELLRTSDDPQGRTVLGMLNNCAGGMTPWGTWLSGEENFYGYFSVDVGDADLPEVGPPEAYPSRRDRLAALRERENAVRRRRREMLRGQPGAEARRRYGLPGGRTSWHIHHDRFDMAKEPNEANRFGWVVEIDPTDPTSTPRKRTALGRFKHEGAETVLNGDGRLVVYMGDDQRFDYVYKFVTAGRFDPDDRSANLELLDEGTLYVARFDPDGTGRWLPLVHGQEPLATENGFSDQGQVLIHARLAADALGATPMDRPEDIAPGPDGQVYIMLTNNDERSPDEVDAANPRSDNAFGHIVAIRTPQGDHASESFDWSVLLLCGDPARGDVGATFGPETSENGWFGMPDNCVVDAEGRLWVATDGNTAERTGRADGLWALDADAADGPVGLHFFRCPAGAELTGPFFAPDQQSLFVSVQHPGEGGTDWPEFGRRSTYSDPSTRWPDFDPDLPPRPAVVVITRRGGGQIGS